MRFSSFARLIVSLALLSALGCASAGLTPESPQPIARASLQPEYRVFYDALNDYGEWILIEPYGFVFRPRVAWNQWQPFEDGFWAPTDAYGWVWISAEPFGWATYHYGQWFWDRFQGWVWTPGLDWSPGWVTWEIAGNYVGWGPIAATSGGSLATSGSGAAPSSAMHYAPLAQLGATDLHSRLVTPEQIAGALREARPVRNLVQRGGVTFNRGPAIGLVEQLSGPLARVRIEDLVPADLGRRIAGAPSRSPAGGGGEPASRDSTSDAARARGRTAADDNEAIRRTVRAAEVAAAQARQLMLTPNSSPGSVPVVRPILPSPADGTEPGRRRDGRPARRRESAASADTTR